MKRTRFDGPSNLLRRELERFVVSTNIVLKHSVHYMGIIELLRNSHPNYRSDYAFKLKEAGMIHPSEATEFTAIPKTKTKFTWYG